MSDTAEGYRWGWQSVTEDSLWGTVNKEADINLDWLCEPGGANAGGKGIMGG